MNKRYISNDFQRALGVNKGGALRRLSDIGFVARSKKVLALSTAMGAAFLMASPAFAADPVEITVPDDFEAALAALAAGTSGSNALEYTGVAGGVGISSEIDLSSEVENLLVDVNVGNIQIGKLSESVLTIGKNSVMNTSGDVYLGYDGGEGSLIIDGGEVNISQIDGPNAMAIGYTGNAGHLTIKNGGVLNMGVGEEDATYAQFFVGYNQASTVTLDNGHINFGEKGASIRLGLGNESTVNLLNGSVIDSSRGASHLWIGEWSDKLVTLNIDDSSIIILGGGTNTAIDERAFVVGYAGGHGVVNQSGDDSHVHIAGIYRIGIAAGNGANGTYNLNGGLLEIGTEDIADEFWVGVNVYDSNNAATAVFNVNGGTAKLHGNLEIGSSGSGDNRPDSTVNINGGTVSIARKVNFGKYGKLNLNGGVLELGGTDAITGSGAMTFDGGAIRATSELSILHAAVLNDDGAHFDSNGHLITYSGILSGVGGVTKDGAGTLLLDAANTYTGGVTVRAGTLETGHANALGAAGGRVTLDGGTLKLSTQVDLGGGITAGAGSGVVDMMTHDVTLGGASTGAGGVTFNNGNLSLAGTLGWSGETVLGEGVTLTTTAANQLSANSTLKLDATATLENGAFGQAIGGLAGSGAVNSAGALSVGSNDTSTQFDGVISGAASLRKIGTGTLTITRVQRYTGDTIIEDGTLALAGDGAIAADSSFQLLSGVLNLGGKTQNASQILLQGGAVTNGTLNLTGAYTVQSGILDTALTGSGSITKTGNGTLTLGESFSGFTGDMIVQSGEVRGAISSFGAGTIQNNGLVTFVESGPAVWAGAITGTGNLALSGGGSFEIVGDGNTYSGQTLLRAGTLRVNGSLANSVVHVSDGATLGGTGTVGGVVLTGVVAPGNSIGTLSVSGDVQFDTGSTYQVEVNADGSGDLIVTTGAARLNGGVVQVLAEEGNYLPRNEYTILTADGGVTGRFDSVSSNYAFLVPTLTYGANEVGLQLDRNDVSFGEVTWTDNENAVAGAVEQLGYGNALYNAALYSTEEQARAGFAMLSGEVHASVRSALIEDSRHVRDAVGDRITRAAGDPGVALWTAGFANWGGHDGTTSAVSTDRDTQGVFVGLDAAVSSAARIGIVAGYSSGDLSSTRGSADTKATHIGAYAGAQFGGLGVQVGVAQSWHQVETSRSVDFNGFKDALTADYDGDTTQVFADVGYAIPIGATSITPFANIAHVHLSTDGFDEQGGAAALSAGSEKADVSFSTLGARFAAANLFGNPGVALRGTAGWRHAFNDRLPSTQLAFDSSDAFSVGGAPLSKNAAVLGLGVDVKASEKVSLSLGYSGQVGGNGSDHGVKASLSLGF